MIEMIMAGLLPLQTGQVVPQYEKLQNMQALLVPPMREDVFAFAYAVYNDHYRSKKHRPCLSYFETLNLTNL